MPLVVLTAVAAIGLSVLLSRLSGDRTFAPASLTFIGVAAGLAYAVTALRARPIVTWAVKRTFGSLRQLLPMVTRPRPGPLTEETAISRFERAIAVRAAHVALTRDRAESPTVAFQPVDGGSGVEVLGDEGRDLR